MSSPVWRGFARSGTRRLGLRVWLVAVAVSIFSALAAPAAFAGDAAPGGKLGPGFDPNTTNIPYLAWAGEQVRLVKCGDFPEGAEAEWLPDAVDWSGNGHNRPQLVTSSVRTLAAANGWTCFAATWISDKAGLAMIKLKIHDDGVEITEHQFLVAWMSICANTLTEVNSPELGDFAAGAAQGTGIFNARSGEEVPITAGFGRLQAQVKGCIPMGENFVGLFPNNNVTLPDDWAALANQFAREADQDRSDDAMRWDIHDTQITANNENHVDNNTQSPTFGTFPCDGPNNAQGNPIFPAFVGPDTVDNCLSPDAIINAANAIGPQAVCDDGLPGVGAPEVGSFSRVFGDLTTCPTVGPFDPQRPDETLLSDGQLNAGDAPMPPVRVDFSIAGPSGTGIDGVGILCGPGSGGNFINANCTGVDKHVVRSRNGLGDGFAHNLDSPFYAAYIPATDAPDPPTDGAFPSAASGVTGVHGANNFPGFLNEDNPYHFWDHVGTDLTNFPVGGNVSRCNRFLGDLRTGPVGSTTVTVYSDEHGEAQSWYDPGGFDGDGFFFDRIPGVSINLDGGCDLQTVRVLGTSSIRAIARYPYEPVVLPDVTSNAVDKQVLNRFNKSISCVNKGATPDVARLCTITALDIDGRPFGFVPGTDPLRREIVCLSIQDGSSVRLENGFTSAPDPHAGTNRTCGLINADGILQVVVLSSVGRPVDLIADFTDQGLFRDCFVDFTPGGAGNCIAPGPGQPGNPGQTPPPAGPTSSAPANQTVVIPARATSRARFSVAFTRIVNSRRFGRYLQVRVNARNKANKRVRIRIRIVDRKGRSRSVTRRIRTNRKVNLRKLPLAGARRVRVTILGRG
jgi:hypothetical protein